MPSRRLTCSVAALALTLLLWAPSRATQVPAEQTRARKVLIVGIDGCRPDALKAAKAPHLHGLIREGAFSDQAQTGDATISGPGWTSMLTGVWRQKHGVRDNRFEGHNPREFPHLFRRVKQAMPRANTVSIVHWAPIAERIVVDADVSTKHKNDEAVTREAVQILLKGNPDVMFLHFDEVDYAGHKYGFHPKVPQYVQAIERADTQVGAVLTALRQRKTYEREDWLILVSTDHGGSGKGHGKDIPEHRTIFLIVSGPSAARGVIDPAPGIVDVTVTALVHLGVALDPRWRLDGRAVGLRQENQRPPK
ncbi:MAG: alkaline phosphatase family protein [Gemmataceae bacterium]|nr:alkaline phosphatase family protein [Gemmataceae bacterium]